jgi:hypothetical protein
MRGMQLIAYQVINNLVPKASKSLIPCSWNHPRGPLEGINTAGKVATKFSMIHAGFGPTAETGGSVVVSGKPCAMFGKL